MQGNKRVYPGNGLSGKWLSYLLLFLSLVVLLSGLVWRGNGEGIFIELSATETPIPTDESFDDTQESREISLPASAWVALQLGAFEDEKSASELSEQFRKRGAAGYVWHDTRFRTLAAVYPTREDAQNVRTQLQKQHTIETFLYQINLPALRLRMNGMKGQLDILEAGFLHANDLIAREQEIGLTLDRQENSVASAIQQLAEVNGQMDLVALRLKQRFIQPRHQSVQGLIECFENYSEFCRTLSNEDSEVTLATKIKYQTIHTLYLLKNVYDALGNS
ncbi:MAG: SPOR domain-containing protein [Clostridia bacterium]